MATIRRFEDLEVWQKARELSKEIIKITSNTKLSKDFSLKDQIKRSSGSIMDNIAEGFERGGRKEFIQFLSIAKGSAGELKSQLYRVLDNDYINENVFNEIYIKANDISKMLNGFIEYLKDSGVKGYKYKTTSN